MASIKEAAVRLVESLPASATWDDLMYAIYVHQKVAQGQADAVAGKVVPQAKARKRAAKT